MSQRVCEILDSIGGSQMLPVKKFFVPLCISDKSVLQCWFSFFWFKHCKVQPVNDQLLILERRRWSVRKIGIFVVIPLPALHRSVDSAINSKRGLEFFVFVFHREVMKIFLIITHHWLGISKQHPLTREPDPPLFSTSATTLCLLNLFLMCKPCVTKYSRHYTRIHKIVMILCFLWIVSDEGVWKMMTGRIVSMNSLCRHDARKQGSMCGNWLVGLEPNKHQGKMIHTRERPNGQWQQNWQKWREVRCCQSPRSWGLFPHFGRTSFCMFLSVQVLRYWFIFELFYLLFDFVHALCVIVDFFLWNAVDMKVNLRRLTFAGGVGCPVLGELEVTSFPLFLLSFRSLDSTGSLEQGPLSEDCGCGCLLSMVLLRNPCVSESYCCSWPRCQDSLEHDSISALANNSVNTLIWH